MKSLIPLLCLLTLDWSTSAHQCKLTSTEVLCSGKDLSHMPRIQDPLQYEVLDLAGNDLDELFKADFYDFSNLKYLKLNYNAITYIEDDTFVGLLNLEILDLSKNILEEVPDEMVEKNSALVSLDLSENMFSFKTPALISKSLEVLNLSFSKISYFSKENIRYLPSLRVLRLQSNNLITLDVDLFKLPPLFVKVDVNHNPWECSCDTIKTFKKLSEKKLFKITKVITCSKNKSFFPIYDQNGAVDNDFYCNERPKNEIEQFTSTTSISIADADGKTPNLDDKITKGIKSLEEILKMEKLYFQDLRKEKDILDSVAMLSIKILIFVIFISGIVMGILISTIMNRRIRRIKSKAILRSESFA